MRQVEIIRDGYIINVSTHVDLKVIRCYEDKDCPIGDHYYYVHVIFAGEQRAMPFNQSPVYGNHAWTSPVRVTRREIASTGP